MILIIKMKIKQNKNKIPPIPGNRASCLPFLSVGHCSIEGSPGNFIYRNSSNEKINTTLYQSG